MRKYRYEIVKEDKGYVFILYPNNITYQEVGRSIYYLSYDECYSAWKKFKIYVKNNKIDGYNSKYIRILKRDNYYYFEYIKNNEIIFYRLNGYNHKESAKKIIGSIYKHIYAEMK